MWINQSINQSIDATLDIRTASRGLHFAIRRLREELFEESQFKTYDPITLAPYIHMGG